jgi:hypothetical protein
MSKDDINVSSLKLFSLRSDPKLNNTALTATYFYLPSSPSVLPETFQLAKFIIPD